MGRPASLTVSGCHFWPGFGDEEIIDRNSPTITKPATMPDINIFDTLLPTT